tara:strand:- start:5160 stop:6593 length:1434 start_codon:yes stop_codon:yes gene_type:complete
MSKYKRLGRNIFLVFIGNAGAKLLNLLLLPFYTRWLSVEDYGITDMLNVYVMLLTGLVTASIAEAVFVFPKNASKDDQKSYFSSGLFIALVFLLLTGLIFLISKNLLIKSNLESIFTDYTLEIYILLIVNFLQSYFQQFCRGIDKMKVYSSTGIVLTLTTALYSFFFIPTYGVNGFVWAMILASLSAAIYSFIASGAFRYLAFNFIIKKRYQEMLKYSLPLMPNAVMWWFIGYLNRPLIETYAGLNSVGLLAVANKFPSAITMLFGVFFYSWQISVIEEFGKDGYNQFYNKILRLLIFALCLGSILLAIMSKFIISLVTAEEFHQAWVYIPVLALAPLLQAISSYSSANFTASKETKYAFYSSIIGAGASILFNFLLIPDFGIWGAVISIVLAHLTMSIARVGYAWRYVKITNLPIILLTLFLTASTCFCISYIQTFGIKWTFVIIFLLVLFITNFSMLKLIYFNSKLSYIKHKQKV